MSLSSIKWPILHRGIKALYLLPDPKSHEVFKLKNVCVCIQKSLLASLALQKYFFPVRREEISELKVAPSLSL